MNQLDRDLGDEDPIEPKPPFLIRVGRSLAMGVYGSYLIGIMVMTIFYNYQFARDNGFVTWLFLGEVAPTGKAIVWPYFVVADHMGNKDSEAKRAYWKAVFSVGKDHPDDSNYLAGRLKEREDSQGKRAGQLLLAEILATKRKYLTEDIAKLEVIKPPASYQEFQTQQVDFLKTSVNVMQGEEDALKKGDQALLSSWQDREKELHTTMLKFYEKLYAEYKSVGAE